MAVAVGLARPPAALVASMASEASSRISVPAGADPAQADDFDNLGSGPRTMSSGSRRNVEKENSSCLFSGPSPLSVSLEAARNLKSRGHEEQQVSSGRCLI
ncbi:hypothetical protein CDD83_9669 [Cordyceps sp. RAO-2017]|nr:hypothetical protein CDD83_9669 [Cordyceps sp. RAO-2017]